MAFTKTFEKFCKLYIMKNGGKCVNENKFFFTEDCAESCVNLTLKEKSKMYKNEYQCFREELSVNKAWDIHKSMLLEANKMIEKYNQLGYKEIQPNPTIR